MVLFIEWRAPWTAGSAVVGSITSCCGFFFQQMTRKIRGEFSLFTCLAYKGRALHCSSALFRGRVIPIDKKTTSLRVQQVCSRESEKEFLFSVAIYDLDGETTEEMTSRQRNWWSHSTKVRFGQFSETR
ncbi:hypothetical protein AVEN_222906-1 [Araneus ventricosus]|uniref:Uncharacterized protein n=1 Tax=Araneus ventricosus TaxID=182803 RepID=A0A4Y2DDM0_ARAVE|nr:hypothetical protein AVEN_222906-1 [Araneus ventricosus]